MKTDEPNTARQVLSKSFVQLAALADKDEQVLAIQHLVFVTGSDHLDFVKAALSTLSQVRQDMFEFTAMAIVRLSAFLPSSWQDEKTIGCYLWTTTQWKL
jgi:hypothetical protein